jgi:two-component sensor histidine kinase
MNHLFSMDDFMPHGMCYLWEAQLLFLHTTSDLLIAFSYYSIPLALLFILYKRKQGMEYGWLLALFAAFILACGTTHILNMVVIWHPIYYIEGFTKLITGVISATTAFFLWVNLPRLITMPTVQQIRTALEAEKKEQNNALLLKEVHHRLKNTLQTVCSLLSLSSRNLPEHYAYHLQDTMLRIKSMANVYERLARKDGQNGFNLNDNLEDISRELARFWITDKRGIEVTYKGVETIVHLDKVSPLLLVIHELIVNAFKYSSDGKVEIALKNNPHMELTITNPIARSAPFPDCITGLGSRIVSGLCKQLGATIQRDFGGSMAKVVLSMPL